MSRWPPTIRVGRRWWHDLARLAAVLAALVIIGALRACIGD